MRNSIQLTAVMGFAFLVIRFVGLFIDIRYKELFLILGAGILLLVTLPLYLLERRRYNNKKASILKKYQGEQDYKRKNDNKKKDNPDYPSFRKQKTGLTWGGGSVHGSRAKRGSKRGFLKR